MFDMDLTMKPLSGISLEDYEKPSEISDDEEFTPSVIENVKCDIVEDFKFELLFRPNFYKTKQISLSKLNATDNEVILMLFKFLF